MNIRQLCPLLGMAAACSILLAGCVTNQPQSRAGPGPAVTDVSEQPVEAPAVTVSTKSKQELFAPLEPKPGAPKTDPESIEVKPETPVNAEVFEAPVIRDEPSAKENAVPSGIVTTETTEPLAFTLEQLPITIEGTWILKNGPGSCTLHTQTRHVDDGAGKTPITLVLTLDNWTLYTKSDIDISYAETGLDLDNGTHFELENVVRETNVQFVKQRQSLINSLQTSKSMTVSLGFWPTWPVTETKHAVFSVQNFDRAYQSWQTCNQRLNAG